MTAGFLTYGFVSLLSASVTVLYAYALRFQFYSTVVHLASSKVSLLVLSNFFIFLVMSFGKFSNWVFFGSLRQSEWEMLWENSGYAITEICLALTIFRDELNMYVTILFVMLLFVKVFHWLLTSRVEYLDQTEVVSKLQHIRITSLLILLLAVDLLFSYIAISDIITTGEPSVNLLFGFEFVLLTLDLLSTLIKYGIHVATHTLPNNEATRWHNKSLYELLLKLVIATVRLVVYSVFFAVVFTWYGLPIHLMRQLFLAFRTVRQRLSHFSQFLRVSQALKHSFPDATKEQLDETDKVCIICREEMEVPSDANAATEKVKRLKCGHMFHYHCLRNWFERQLKCPTCRSDVMEQLGQINVSRQRQQNLGAPAQANQAAAPAQPAEAPSPPPPPPPQVQARPVPRAEQNAADVRPPPPPPPPPPLPQQRRQLPFEGMLRRRIHRQHGTIGREELYRLDGQRMMTPVNSTDVNSYLANQIDIISLQLELYSVQLKAAAEAREATLACIEMQAKLARQSSPTNTTTDNQQAEPHRTEEVSTPAHTTDVAHESPSTVVAESITAVDTTQESPPVVIVQAKWVPPLHNVISSTTEQASSSPTRGRRGSCSSSNTEDGEQNQLQPQLFDSTSN